MLIQITLKRILKKLFSVKKLIIFTFSLIFMVIFYLIFNNELHSEAEDYCTGCAIYDQDPFLDLVWLYYEYHVPTGDYGQCYSNEHLSNEGYTCEDEYCSEYYADYSFYDVYTTGFDPELVAQCCYEIGGNYGSPFLVGSICDKSTAFVPCYFPPELNGGSTITCCEY